MKLHIPSLNLIFLWHSGESAKKCQPNWYKLMHGIIGLLQMQLHEARVYKPLMHEAIIYDEANGKTKDEAVYCLPGSNFPQSPYYN